MPTQKNELEADSSKMKQPLANGVASGFLARRTMPAEVGRAADDLGFDEFTFGAGEGALVAATVIRLAAQQVHPRAAHGTARRLESSWRSCFWCVG
jgi:hypothetical protein